MKKVILKIEGMTCSACSSSLEKYLNKQDGISDALVNLVMATAEVECDDKVTIEKLNKYVDEAGYKLLGEFDPSKEEKSKNRIFEFVINGLLVLVVLYIGMGQMIGLPIGKNLDMNIHPVIYSTVLMFFAFYFISYGKDILRVGFKNIIHKTPNMDSLVTLGVLTSFIYSVILLILINSFSMDLVSSISFDSVVVIIYLVKLGRYIENKNIKSSRDAIKNLVTITPPYALIKKKDGEEKATIDEVKKGDILIVKPGDKIAVDGTVVSGKSHVDESFISGEANPVKKSKGDKVVAGSININGSLEYEAVNIGHDSTVSEIVRMVVECSNSKTNIVRITDKICSIFVPAIMIIAFLTFGMHLILGFTVLKSIVSFVNVLVVACPCALGLAVPLAIVVSTGVSSKNGILIRNSQIIENINKIDTIVFDKTGTLTHGKLSVSEVINYSDIKDNEIIKIVSSLENRSNHPISTAFTYDDIYDVEKFNTISGVGLFGIINGDDYYVGNNKLFEEDEIDDKYTADEEKLSKNANSIIYVIKNRKVIALIGVKDTVRKSAISVVKKLKKMGKNIYMLSGDNEVSAKVIADELGIDNVIANVLPKDKEEKIKELINKGNKVMMVGDGINDAPALTEADVGVSVGTGTDIAINSSDVVIIDDNLNNIGYMFEINNKTNRIIKQNLFWAFFYNIIMIPIAAGLFVKIGLEINPMISSIAMMISSLTVVLNTLRIYRWRDK